MGNEVSVTVIDKESSFVMGFSLLRVMLGEKTEQEVSVSRERISQKGIQFVNSEINEIDVKNSLVRTGIRLTCIRFSNRSPGCRTCTPEKVSDFESYFHMFTLEDAKKLRDALSSFKGGLVRLVVSSTPFKCSQTPYEAAMLIDDHLRGKGLRDKSRHTDIHARAIANASSGS